MVNNSLHEKYISRCIQLAKQGIRNTSPNPIVGSVIVYKDKIIGESYHQRCGESHAEINAINSVKNKDLLKKSTLYVSLEPCAHVGRTPSCAKTITEIGIPNVVIGCIDPFDKVSGNGIKILENSGINVISRVLEKECISLNKRFFTYHEKKRPYIILKWAETLDGYIDIVRTPDKPNAAWITNAYCKTLVHKWRTEEDAFLVGSNTVILDNPQLTARKWSGNNPLRIIIDSTGKLRNSYKIFNSEAPSIIFNPTHEKIENSTTYIKIDFNENIIPQILNILYQIEVQSIVIEGGALTLSSFISYNIWDEARVFIGNKQFYKGIEAPKLCAPISEQFFYNNDKLLIYNNNEYI